MTTALRQAGSQKYPMESQEVAPTGRLEDVPSRWVVGQLYTQEFSGYLLLQHKDRRKKLWFHRGQIFKIQSNLLPELLGRMMVDRQWLNEADLKSCLEFQKDLIQTKNTNRPLGQLVEELHGLDRDEIDALVEQQKIQSLFQALTWSSGTYEFVAADLKGEPQEHFPYDQLLQSLVDLMDTGARSLPELLSGLELWRPSLSATDLSKTPLWSILAGCRKRSLSGIISIRRQNRLYELVLKHGIPLTYYEGSFGQPRQTIVVRRASEEHERYFVEQLFKLLSFLTGNVSFRMLESEASSQDEVENVRDDQFREESTAVTKSVHPAELLQASSDKLQQVSARFMHSVRDRICGFKTFVRRTVNHFRQMAGESLQKFSAWLLQRP